MRRVRDLMLMLALALAAGAVQPLNAQQAKPTATTGRTFVGEVRGADAFVAVWIPEGGGDDRESQAYLCDGRTFSEWFTGGPVENGEIALRSEGGATLNAGLVDESVVGSITLSEGRALSFEAVPAAGIAGLYEIGSAGDRLLRGASAEGVELEVLVAREPQTEPTTAEGRYRVIGFVTPAGSEPRVFEALATSADLGTFRAVVLDDGRIKGRKSGGQNFLMPVED